MSDDKDRFGQKLHQVEKAREDQWARQLDEQLVAKLREKFNKGVKCPECDSQLVAEPTAGLDAMVCPDHHGAWLGWESLRKIQKDLESK